MVALLAPLTGQDTTTGVTALVLGFVLGAGLTLRLVRFRQLRR
jgi:hypothetical protein